VATLPSFSGDKASLGSALKKGLQLGSAAQGRGLTTLDGPSKAAVMLMLLGPERATEIMQQFSAEEVSRVSSLMPSLQALDRDTLIDVLEEFRSTTQHQKTVAFNPSQFVQSLLEKFSSGASAGGWQTNEEINAQLPALEAFSRMPTELLCEHLGQEHPQVAATLLSLIDPSVSAQVLESMEAEQRNELVLRIALLDRIDPSVLDDLNEVLERATQPAGLGSAGGLGGVVPVADIIANFPTGLDRQTLSHIQTFDGKLASQIQSKVFMFEDFLRIEPMSLQRIVSEVPADALVGALKGAPPRLRQAFMDAMTKRMAERVQFEMDSMGPVKVQEAERRQREVIAEARKLEAQGLVSLERVSADASTSLMRDP
jgi:flagellar motor switch protein FliG